jgi:hypothetical protein
MPRFSERRGLKAPNPPQIDQINQSLRNRLWNVVYTWILQYWWVQAYATDHRDAGMAAQRIIRRSWNDFLKRPADLMPENRVESGAMAIKGLILEGEWSDVYDWLEFFLELLPPKFSGIMEALNNVLIAENSAYRVVQGQVTPITSAEEISTIEEAAGSVSDPVREHLQTALELFSDRGNPDYRNSIKEAISAVESLSRRVSGGKTLGDALKTLRTKIALHPALEKSFSALYGYTSDKGGIRHALLDDSSVDDVDARFMLVACSAFINFVTAKAAASGIELN